MTGILIFFHCPSNTGYAISRHEYTFSQMAYRLTGSYKDVHYGYPSLESGPSKGLPLELNNFIEFDSRCRDSAHWKRTSEYIRKNDIKIAFGFDQPVSRPGYKCLRSAGVKYIFSYLGAPMSSLNSGAKLLLKRIKYHLQWNGPDHFIFQSEDMRETATHGVGIPRSQTSVVRSGVDTDKFRPSPKPNWYAHDIFGIDRMRKIIYYSGHMEERKGVHVIVKAAAYLINKLRRTDLHFLFLGNRNGEEKVFDPIYIGTEAEHYITFAGYRDDVAQLQSACYLAVIATTGWDSHTMTAVEVAASGLPLIVSDIAGLRETVTDDTGLRFPIGDHIALATRIALLADNEVLRDKLGAAARERVLNAYTRDHQIAGLESVVRRVAGNVL